MDTPSISRQKMPIRELLGNCNMISSMICINKLSYVLRRKYAEVQVVHTPLGPQVDSELVDYLNVLSLNLRSCLA